ncbi:hypothetical protein AOLI_G00244340 [Acnodon oligacanthus]
MHWTSGGFIVTTWLPRKLSMALSSSNPAGTTSGQAAMTDDPVSTRVVHGIPSGLMEMWQKSDMDICITTVTV